MTRQYFLKGATPREKYRHMNRVLAFREELQNAQTERPDRHNALAEIERLAPGEAFHNWYDRVYQLRKAGLAAEYEAAIYARLDELQRHQNGGPDAG